jgi:hypothetical protein
VIWLELAAALQVAPGPAPDSELGGALELVKLLGTGGATTFAVLAWQALRHERRSRTDERERESRTRSERQRELDARLSRIETVLARLDERTGFLIGAELGPDPAPLPAPRRGRARTPAGGVRVPLPRKPTESDE